MNLIIEDNDTHRLILEKRLAVWGLAFASCSHGKEALRIIQESGEIDLILTDLYMPIMDGHELAETLKEQGIDIPIILFTALGANRTMKETGLFQTVLAKPLRQKAILRAIKKVFLVEEEHLSEHTEDNSSLPGRNKDLRIILAEDNLVNQKLAMRMLQRLGYEADIANNGLEVLEKLEAKPYDIILMDVQMPELDGISATRRIRHEFPAEKQAIIIAMTANAMQGDREKCIDAGMSDYISKPFRLAELEEMLKKYAKELQL